MADSTLSRQTFLRLGGALGGALAATGMVAGGASAAPRPRVPAPRASGGPLLEGGEFPIGIFWPPPPYQTTVDRYRQIVDAGFTYVHSNNYLFADWQIQQHALRIADQVGLKVLVDDDDLRWITRNFRISDDGGPFTLTRDEAETLVRQIVNRYAPTRYWRLRDGRLLFDGGTGDGSIGWALDGAGWTDYVFEFTATPLPTGAGGYAQAGWAFRVQDERNAYVWIIGDRDTGGGNGNLTRAIFVDGAPQVTTVQLPFPIEPDTAYRVRTEVVGTTITTSVDGVVVDTVEDATYASGSVGFREAGSESALFDDVVVTAADGTVLLTEDFSGDLSAWRTPGGGGFESYAGLHVFDEPGVDKLPDLGVLLDIIRTVDPDNLPYVNHLPGFDYEAAVEHLDPEVLSFDRYPILESGEDGGFFANWAAVRAAALPQDIPTWAYIQSVGYTAHAVPDKDDLYWQINVALAYGCKGIQYFTYWTPDPARGENFHEALIQPDGRKTPLYAASAEVNNDYLAPIGRQLLPLTSTAVQAANLTQVPDGLAAFEPDDEIAATSGDGLVLGRFDGPDDARYVLVVNHSRHEQAHAALTWGSAVTGVATYDPKKDRWADQRPGDLAVRLKPGRATLVCLTR